MCSVTHNERRTRCFRSVRGMLEGIRTRVLVLLPSLHGGEQSGRDQRDVRRAFGRPAGGLDGDQGPASSPAPLTRSSPETEAHVLGVVRNLQGTAPTCCNQGGVGHVANCDPGEDLCDNNG